ncbi:MAG: TonB-dependent receptor [Acidobacteriota bacterium]
MFATFKNPLLRTLKPTALKPTPFQIASGASLAARGLLIASALLAPQLLASDAPSDTREEETPEEAAATFEAEVLVTSTLPDLISTRDLDGSRLDSTELPDLTEHLRTLPGLSAVRRGSINLEPTLRGLQEDQIATSVDGTRTFAAGPARMDSNLSHVGVHSTSSVRVVKGPFALSWGAGALAAIDLQTHRPSFREDFTGTAGFAWAENGERSDAFLRLRGAGERVRYSLSAGRRDGSDYESGDGAEVPGDYESTETRWRLGFALAESWSLDYSGGYQEQNDLDYPGRLLDATYFYARSHNLELRREGDDGSIREALFQVYANRKDHLMNNDEKPTGRDMPGRIPPFALDIDLPTESNTLGGRARLDFADRERTSWSVGADFYRVEQNANRAVSRRSNGFVIFRDIVWPDTEIEDLGGWVQAVHRVGPARLGATLRVDAVDASAGLVSDFFLANAASSDLDQSETNVSAAVSASVDLSSAWALEVGVGRAVRTATALERYSDRFPATRFQIAAEFMGNPELDPEASFEIDAGVRYRGGSRFFFSAEGFYRTVDDFITIAPDSTLSRRLPLSPTTVFRYINGDRATYYGAEVSFDHRTTDRFSWRLDLEFVRATDEELDEPVLGISPLTLRLAARGEAIRDLLWLDFAVRFQDDQDRVATSRFEQPTDGSTVVDLGAEIDLGRVTLEVDGLNLLDEEYADHLNAPNPFTGQRILEIGRSFRLAVAVDF